MRARKAFLAAALLLAACNESVAPHAPGRYVEPPEPPVVEPVSPTEVLDAPGETARPPPAPVPMSVTARADLRGLEEGARGLSSVSHVDVEVTLGGARGNRTVSVEFIPPSGHPYERRSTPVDLRLDTPRTLRFTFPVAGTTVATSGMSGTWQALFFLDGEPLTTAAFTLEP